ncbi:MAG TPA: hypothetical protein VHY33_10235, partial [Thermoanaerobaculia bacterium]|nr:hypothetical protein [Thermoanaerobaculia bacterium]
MFHRLDQCASGRSAQRFTHAAHERGRNRRAAAASHPLRGSALAECIFENGHQRFAMLHTLR